MVNFLLLMIIPVALTVAALVVFKGKVTLAEAGGMLAIPALCVAIGLAIAYYQSVKDVELWNGRVIGKHSEHVSCSHSYRCMCYESCSGIGKDRSCTEICQTCYEHSYDVSWYVNANTNEQIEIDRVDRQGLSVPPRYNTAYVNEPFSSSHTYDNYILANPSSVLTGGKGDLQKFGVLIPDYPTQIFDYYHTNHVINAGNVPVADIRSWEWLITNINSDLGPTKQVNVILLFVKTDDPAYVTALRDKWIGGKKNDAIIVLGSLDGHTVAFADVVSWSSNPMFSVKLKDDLTEIGSLDRRDDMAAAIRNNTTQYFTRMHMKDYEYLMSSFQPSAGAMIFLFILGIASCAGFGFWAITNDVDDDSPYYTPASYNPYSRKRYRS